MNVAQVWRENIERYGEYRTLSFAQRDFTNVELDKMASSFAGGLKKRGLQENDRVVVILPNTPEVLISYHAIVKTGAVIVPVTYSLSSSEIQYIVKDCEPRMIIADQSAAGKVEQAIECLASKPIIIHIDGPEDEPNRMSAIIDSSEPYTDICKREVEDLAAIIYTSGTTALAKGAMITHGNIYAGPRLELQALGLLSPEGQTLVERNFSMLVVLPISHIYGLTMTVMAYVLGARIVLLSRFDAKQVVSLIEEEQIHQFAGVPTMFHRFSENSEKYGCDLSSVKYWVSGGAPLPHEVRLQFEQRYQAKIIEGYGLTESTSGFALQRLDKPQKANSVGQALPGVEVMVVDENNNRLGCGAIGELAIKGPNVMKGYYRMEEETAKVIQQGWLLTGDVGYIDEDGDIFLVERKKDMIIRGGFNVYPKEVEHVLMNHPAIMEAGVIGVSDQEMGEIVKAFVVLKSGMDASETEVIDFCKRFLAKYKVPQYVEFISALPKNDLGKVLRKELRMISAKKEAY